jgi:hypothetical protein
MLRCSNLTNAKTTRYHAKENMAKLIKRRYKMRLNFTRRMKNVQALFNGHYIDAKVFYVVLFEKIPSVCFIGCVDAVRASDYISESLRAEIVAVFQHSYFDHDKQVTLSNNTLFVMTSHRLIEVATGYVHVLYEPCALAEVEDLMRSLAGFKMDPEPGFQTQVVGFARQPGMN